MIRLPFKTEPKPELYLVGDEASGTLEIPKLGDLTPNERIFITEEMKALPDVRIEGVKIAKTIAQAMGKSLMETYEALTRGNMVVLSEYIEEVLNFQQLVDKVGDRRELVMTTAIVRFRLVPDWTLADTGDVAKMPPKLRKAIFRFAQNEEAGWAEPEPLTEEILGESFSGEDPPSQTGEVFSGESETIFPTTTDSVPSDSDSSLVA